MNKKTAQILRFNQVRRTDIPYVGGKGANLGEMISADIPVPDGFIVTAKAYYDFIKLTSLKQKILTELTGLDVDDSNKLQQASKNIKTAILKAKMPDELAGKIQVAYHELCGKHDRLVAVRSSATAEDLPDASFAGQQETYLNIKGWEDVVKHTQMCWASLFTSRAIFYRTEKGFSHFKIGIAVPVQIMVQSEVSGVMFTINPLTNDPFVIIVESVYGLGEMIVQGSATPDHFEIDRQKWTIRKKELSTQKMMMTKVKGETKVRPVPKNKESLQKISDEIISLPMFPELTEKNIEYVVGEIKEFDKKN